MDGQRYIGKACPSGHVHLQADSKELSSISMFMVRLIPPLTPDMMAVLQLQVPTKWKLDYFNPFGASWSGIIAAQEEQTGQDVRPSSAGLFNGNLSTRCETKNFQDVSLIGHAMP